MREKVVSEIHRSQRRRNAKGKGKKAEEKNLKGTQELWNEFVGGDNGSLEIGLSIFELVVFPFRFSPPCNSYIRSSENIFQSCVLRFEKGQTRQKKQQIKILITSSCKNFPFRKICETHNSIPILIPQSFIKILGIPVSQVQYFLINNRSSHLELEHALNETCERALLKSLEFVMSFEI